MSVMKLYYAPGACSLAPHIVLEEVGGRFELSRVDLAADQQNSPDYLRVNPKARVPALTDGDWTLTEAPAILRYIAARHPAAGLWPWDPREEARCAEWLNWLSSTIHVAFVHVRRAARYASDLRAVEDVAATGKDLPRALAGGRREDRLLFRHGDDREHVISSRSRHKRRAGATPSPLRSAPRHSIRRKTSKELPPGSSQ